MDQPVRFFIQVPLMTGVQHRSVVELMHSLEILTTMKTSKSGVDQSPSSLVRSSLTQTLAAVNKCIHVCLRWRLICLCCLVSQTLDTATAAGWISLIGPDVSARHQVSVSTPLMLQQVA